MTSDTAKDMSAPDSLGAFAIPRSNGAGAPSGLCDMPRVNAIWSNQLFQRHLKNLNRLEADRVWCRHGLPHLLDVARIMRIRCLEERIDIDREVLYAAALLHDIGKDEQYETGISHDVASECVARAVLEALPEGFRFSDADTAAICTAVVGHRRLRTGAQQLERLLYEADKASRACYACPARDTCNWDDENKNLSIRI